MQYCRLFLRLSATGFVAGLTCRAALAETAAIIQPAACEAFRAKPLSDTEPWHQVYFENRSDGTVHVFRISSDGKNKYPSTVLAPGYAEARPGKLGAVWVVEDEKGKCIGAYTAATAGKNERVKIGDGKLLVRIGVPPYRLRATIYPGFSVQPDREETYIDSRDGVFATVCEALNVWVGISAKDATAGAACGLRVNERINTGRQIVVDLNRPVENNVRPLGVVRDRNVDVHVFLSHEHKDHRTRNIQELQPGERAESDRVEFRFLVDGVPHNLLVGPWGPGEFDRQQVRPLHGNGSTRETVRRISETVWETHAADGSVGRLWNNADKANPKDLGLYHVSFRFRFELLPEAAE